MSSKKVRKKATPDSDAIFERAYIYYRRNQNTEALAEIAKGDEEEARFIELKAQLFYRLERCEEALQLYLKFLERYADDDYDETRRANMIAVLTLQIAKGGSQKELPSQLQTMGNFEQMYNYACYLIEQEKFEEALQLLDKAIVKCRETLSEDGLTEREISEEQAVIVVQKAFVMQRLGLREEALKIYQAVLESGCADVNVRATITNNLVSAQAEPNIVNSRNDLRSISRKNRSKLNQQQRRTILFNLALLQLYPTEKTTLVGGADDSAIHFQEIVTAGKTIDKRKQKRRRIRLPKNYDPNMPPDPERWLPKQERSAYKKRLNKRFKDRDIGRGTQGSAAQSTANANIDYSKAPSSTEPSPRVTPANSEGPRQQRPGGAQTVKKGKKKKPGGKW